MQPSSSLATLRPDLASSLTEFDLAMDRMGFIGHRLFPVLEVAKQAGKFGRIPLVQLLQHRDTNRASGSGYSRGTWKFEPDSYATDEHGAEEPIDEREAKMYAEYFDAELVCTERARDAVLRNAEIRAAASIFDAATYTPTTPTHEWDDPANADPVTDVEGAVQRFWDKHGVWPNALVITRKVFRNLRNVESIIDRLKYQGFQDVRPSKITESALAQVFDLPHILVAGSAKNTADEGQTASISPIWSGEYAAITRVAESNDVREPCIGRTFHWGEDGSQIMGTVETYRDEAIRGDVVRVRHDVHEKKMYSTMVELLDNITT